MIWVGAKNKIQGFELICGKAHNGTSTLEWRLTPDPGKEGKEEWWPMVGVYMSTRGWEVGGIKMNPPGSCRSANIWNSISQNIFYILLNLWSIQLVKITDNKNKCNQIQPFSWEEMQLGLIPGSLVCLVATFLGNYPPQLRLKFGR